MKKHIFVVTVCMISILFFSGCALIDSYLGYQLANRQRNEIYSLEVWSAAENDEWIYHVDYPHFYYGFNNTDMGSTTHYDMEHALDIEEIPEETFRYIRDYILGLEDETGDEDSVFAYRIVFYYYDEKGEYQRVYVDGYDEFPKDFDVFTDKVNEICGAPYLTGSGSLQEVTPEFLNEVWGVTDEDVPGGTLQEFIAGREIDMRSLTESFHMQSELKGFYADGKEHLIAPCRPTRLIEKESTQEEYEVFLAEFADRLAQLDIELQENDAGMQDQDNMIRYNQQFYIAKTSDLSKLSTEAPVTEDGYYRLLLDAHMEGMTMAADFIYSKDGKFMLIDCRDVDVQEAFVQ